MTRKRTYLIKEVAELSGVSVRALHHYDELGLLEPRGRTDAGYRLYDDEDLLRLQQILIGRELGLPLEEIRRSLDDPDFDREQALLVQRAELQKRAAQTEAMLRAVDAALAHLQGEPTDLKQIFDGFDPAELEAEAGQRWGNTEELKECRRRSATPKKTGIV